MKTKKPDIFLGITMFMLVAAVLLCIVILKTQKDKNETATTETVQATTTEAPIASGVFPPVQTEPVVTTESVSVQPQNLTPIEDARLQAELNESLDGLTSEWQVMVIDPAVGTKVGSTVNCDTEDWMTANRMAQVFIMGAIFQQAENGELTLDAEMDDIKAMITANDTYAADRLTEKLGGGDAAKGREAVKSFAVANGVKLGLNRSLSGSSSERNFVTAQQTAEILNLICSGKLVSENASRQMLDILLTPVDGLEIETGLTGDGVRCGFITDIESDVCICAMGVVQLPNRSFVISVVCNEPVTTDGAKKKITELISLVQPYFAE
ncbi:MAG: serine hydrolase [Oscillospiraceae bacterium]|nr:serine hydrolase [Oscillospiraceae bacterium]